MKWEKVRLGDVTDSCLGKMLDKEKNRGEYQLYLSNKDVRWGSFDLEHLDLMKFEEHEEERYGVRYGDLIVCEGGEPGRCAIWKDQIPNMKIQKALHRVRVHEGLDYRFLYYWFLWAGKRGELQQYFTGATIKHMPGDKIKSVIITKPDIETQRQIADVLSAYDDLIENNQKQIKLLEEAAQRLYKEWFVDLQFPGHENTEIVDGLPKGWSNAKVTDLLEIKYGKDHKALEEGDIPVYGSGGIMRKVQPVLYSGESVLIPRKGSLNNILFVEGDFWTIDTMFYSIPRLENVAKYAYLYLRGLDMYSFNIGAAVPSMTTKILSGMDIVLPSKQILQQFEEQLSPVFARMKCLEMQCETATEARDRLLPKLMSGEIEL
ncbi:MAG: restriction endonuclease subunit S [Bacillota bacterium]|nr:restriction endonuclease subunit S [Bacillota bacterium]